MLHKHLAHIAPNAIRKMVKRGIIEGIKLVNDGATITCKACEQAKVTHREIWKEHEAPLTDMLGVEVHSDVWGPSPIPSLVRRRYYVTFTNDYSCHAHKVAMGRGSTLCHMAQEPHNHASDRRCHSA